MNKKQLSCGSSLFAILTLCICTTTLAQQKVSVWLTNPDKSALFQQQARSPVFSNGTGTHSGITIDEKQTYQSIDGFGYALTGGSAQHIIRMSASARAALLHELFATDANNIGVSYLRLSIGASDLNERVFSYDDLPAGGTDFTMSRFDLGPDKKDVIPVMQEILKINPTIKILGSPWSPPTWMKTIDDTRGGRLKEDCYEAYALYFVRYIQEMKKAGIVIDAITVQNEPLHPGNNPSLLMPAPDQGAFIKNSLGPAFKKAGLKTKIILYDHNADRPDYPISIMDDPAANRYVDGSAFHLYGGNINALSDVHDAHPEKNVYFTEQMVVQETGNTLRIASPVKRLMIGATRNWSRNVLEWNLAADPQNKPFTDRGGCPMCQGAVTIDGDQVSRNLAYYAIAHASKFVRPGSVRMASDGPELLPNVAFKTPAGKKVLIVVNDSDASQDFTIADNGNVATVQLMARAVATYIW